MKIKTLLVCGMLLGSVAAARAQGGLKLQLRLWLEGAYQDDTMRTTLAAQGLLTAHFTAGGDSTSPIGRRMDAGQTVPVGAVDVVRVELRRNPQLTTPLATAYGWLMSDGTVRDFATGQLPYVVFGAGPLPDYYYLVVKHRNHLPVMSAGLCQLRDAPPDLARFRAETGSIDLGDVSNVFGGGVKPLGGVRYGMIAGDGAQDARAETNAQDFERVTQATRRGTGFLRPLYCNEDVNLDGVVNAADYEITSRANDLLYFASFAAGQP